MRVKRIEVVSFIVVDEQGRTAQLYCRKPIIDIGTHDDPHAEGQGLGEITTTDGRAVNRLARGQYEIVGYPNVTVTSHDPKAP
jgi:hypothetical protein